MHSRSMAVQESYLLHSRQVQKEWRSMNDYILYSKFGFAKVQDDDADASASGLFISSPSLQEAKQEKRVEKRLLLNEYPYYVQEGIEHWCLWKLGARVDEHEIEVAVGELRSRMEGEKGGDGGGELEDVLTWVNPPHLQSVPDIDHAHLLCLRKKRSKCNSQPVGINS